MVKTEKKQEAATATKKVKEIQKSIEKSTLGDLSALSDLKEKMDTASAKKDAAAKEEKAEAPASEEKVAKKAKKDAPKEDAAGDLFAAPADEEKAPE